MILKNTLVRLLLVVPLLAAGIALGEPSPAAAARECSASQPIPVFATVKESVLVPAGATCLLTSAVIRGGVTIEPGGFLQSYATEIRGSISASAPFAVTLESGVVRGSVTVTNAQGGWGVSAYGAEVRGDFVVTGSTADGVTLGYNTVRGSVVLTGNTTVYGTLVHGNVIGVNLDCSGNTPAATNDYGAGPDPNTVGGASLGECAGL